MDCRWLGASGNYDPRIITRLRRVLRDERVDVLFSWLQAADVPAFFARSLHPSTAWVLAERDSAYPKNWRFVLRDWLGVRADAIVANSEAGAEYWGRRGYRGRHAVISNIVTPSQDAGEASSAGQHTALFVGRLEPQKNVITTVQALCVAVSRNARWRFSLVGQGSQLPVLKGIVEDAGVSSAIEFVGFTHEVDSVMRRFRFLVSMSLHEGLPNVLLEAITRGLIPIVSRIPEHEAVLGPNYPFYVNEYGDASSIAEMLEIASVSPLANSSSLAHARGLVASMAPGLVADEYIKLFQSLGAVDASVIVDG